MPTTALVTQRKKRAPAHSPLALRLGRLSYHSIASIESVLRRDEGHAYTWADMDAFAARIEALLPRGTGVMNIVEVYEDIEEERRLVTAYRQYKLGAGGQ